MPTVCIHCAMKAILDGKATPTFPESPEEHTQKHHADLVATQRERAELERRLTEKLAKDGSVR